MSVSAFDELVALRREYEAVVVGRGQEVVDAVLQQFLTAFPEVGAVTWRQYTPTFNDGDACVFSVGELYFRLDRSSPLVGESSPSEDCDYFDEDDEEGEGPAWFDSYAFYDYDYQDGKSRSVYVSPRQQELHEAAKGLQKGFEQIEDVLKAVFNDNVKVTCTLNGYEVEDYYPY